MPTNVMLKLSPKCFQTFASQQFWLRIAICSLRILAVIDAIRVKGDSCGGEVTCVVRNAPMGLGSPVFDKLEAELAKAAMSLPASKVF